MFIRTQAIVLAILLLALPALADLADLDRDLSRADGTVHFSCDARDNIHATSRVVTIDGDEVYVDEHDGLVHLVLRLDDGEVKQLDVRCGGKPNRRERRAEDLGHYPANEVAELCLRLVDTLDDHEAAEEAVVAAALADHEVWPDLARLARDKRRHSDVRESAIFWLGVQAGDKAVADLAHVVNDDDEDVEIRSHAVFALSQALEDDVDEALETLGTIATENPHPDVRRDALFWLAQHDDERVVDLFEKILRD